MKTLKNFTIFLIIFLTIVAIYTGQKKSKRIKEKIKEPLYIYILDKDLNIQKVNYLFPFSPASKNKSIFVDTSAAINVSKIAPSSLEYVIRKKKDDFIASAENKTFPIVLGDGEISFWPIYDGFSPPPEIKPDKILAFSWSENGIQKAKNNPLIEEILSKEKSEKDLKQPNLQNEPEEIFE